MQDRLDRMVGKTDEYINQAAVRKQILVADRVELSIKGHRFPANPTTWPFQSLEERWFTAELMAFSYVVRRPQERSEVACRIVEWLRNEPERR
jgi:hypothetical protein